MISVEKLLQKKGRQIWSVAEDCSVYECIQLMDEKNVGALIVMQEGSMIGIISERDYTRKVVLKNRSSKETPVAQIMTTDVVSAHPKMHVDECLVLMNQKRIRHLPVLNNKQLVGMISLGDAVKEIIDEQKYTIQRLEDNISWTESY